MARAGFGTDDLSSLLRLESNAVIILYAHVSRVSLTRVQAAHNVMEVVPVARPYFPKKSQRSMRRYL